MPRHILNRLTLPKKISKGFSWYENQKNPIEIENEYFVFLGLFLFLSV
jgi:hypothetical protein